MSWLMLAGLAIQASAVVVVLRAVRSRWMSHIGAVFLLVAVIYHGVNELAQRAFPGYNFYREMPQLQPGPLSRWTVYIGMAMMVFACAYVLALRTRTAPALDPARLLRGWPAWWVWGYLTAFATVLTAAAQGTPGRDGFGAGIADQFVALLAITTSVTYVYRHPQRLTLVVLLQSLVLLILGNRLETFAAAAGLVAAVTLAAGVTIPLRKIAIGGVIAVACSLLLVSAREQVGREDYLASSPTTRAGLLLTSLGVLDTETVLDQTVYRIDGNAWGAMLTAAYEAGYDPVGFTPLFNTVKLAIPSFIYRDKLSTATEVRSEGLYIINRVGLPDDVDYLPTTFGIIYGYHGLPGLLVIAALLGVAVGRLDTWLHRRATPFTLIILITCVQAAVMLERGVEVWTITLRGTVVMCGVTLALAIVAASARQAVRIPSARVRPSARDAGKDHADLQTSRHVAPS